MLFRTLTLPGYLSGPKPMRDDVTLISGMESLERAFFCSKISMSTSTKMRSNSLCPSPCKCNTGIAPGAKTTRVGQQWTPNSFHMCPASSLTTGWLISYLCTAASILELSFSLVNFA
uniref:Uncharacterized protein n=1 Tax=Cacopsylla melanoneura TaxID=428564 RepID=A0A8D8TE89_9HEMI